MFSQLADSGVLEVAIGVGVVIEVRSTKCTAGFFLGRASGGERWDQQSAVLLTSRERDYSAEI
jgi:hypothetical protein